MALRFRLVGALVVILLCCQSSAEREEERERSNSKSWISLCKCAQSALRDIRRVLGDYTSRMTGKKPMSFDHVIGNITEIAYECTKTPQCRCPEGFFKTGDGNSCLKISEEEVDCNEAMHVCSGDVNSHLAIAKDNKRLTKLADYIREVDPTDNEFYWIGLSYNRTERGVPVWTWADGSTASYDITSNLKNNVRKSLISVNEGSVLERVAISKDYEGAHWRQERCSARGDSGRVPRHRYICEFTMFRVNIQPVTSKNGEKRNGVGKAGLAK